MAGNIFGTESPRAIEPFQIESTLAPLAAANPAEAQTLLQQYHQQQDVSQDEYTANLAQQHEFAKQQLAQQLYEANLKGVAEAKDPTVLQLMAQSPAYRSNVFGGISDDALTDLMARGRQTQDVTNLEHAGTGINQMSQAGFNPTGAAASVGMTNLGPYAGPALVQAAQIRAAGQVAAANASSKGPKYMLDVEGPPDSITGRPQHASIPIPFGATQAEKDARVADARAQMGSVQASQGTQYGMPVPQSPGSTPGSPLATPSITRLPPNTTMAQGDPGVSGTLPTQPQTQTQTQVAPTPQGAAPGFVDTPRGKTVDNGTAQGQQIQGLGRQGLNKLNPVVQKDLLNTAAGHPGGVLPMIVYQGKPYYVLSNGKPVPVP